MSADHKPIRKRVRKSKTLLAQRENHAKHYANVVLEQVEKWDAGEGYGDNWHILVICYGVLSALYYHLDMFACSDEQYDGLCAHLAANWEHVEGRWGLDSLEMLQAGSGYHFEADPSEARGAMQPHYNMAYVIADKPLIWGRPSTTALAA